MDEAETARWRELGDALTKALEAVEREAAHEWREHVKWALEAGNVPSDEPVRAGIDALKPDVRHEWFIGIAESVFTNVSSIAKRAQVIRILIDVHAWIEREGIEDRWTAFRTAVQENLPARPDALLDAAAKLCDDARESASDPFAPWPMELTGSTVADLIRKSMHEVAKRTGVPLSELPPVPDDDTPAMTWTDAAAAARELQGWLEWRAAWGTVLGLLAKHLRPA